VRGYEIFSWSDVVFDDFLLSASITTTGVLTFTLTLLGTDVEESETRPFSTWMVDILTYRNQGIQRTWSNIARNTTLNRFVTSSFQSLSPVVVTPDGETFCQTAQTPELFWEELKNTIHGTCASALAAYLSFANGVGEPSEWDIPEEEEPNSWNQENWPNGHGYP